DLAAIDRELRTVIATMRDAPDRRCDLAAWSAQALAQLPEEVCTTDAARILGSVARAWVATPRQIAAMTPPLDSLALVQSLEPEQSQPNLGSIALGPPDRTQGGVSYLVADYRAVTNALGLGSILVRFPQLTTADIIALDEDADIALLALREPTGQPPLELEPE